MLAMDARVQHLKDKHVSMLIAVPGGSRVVEFNKYHMGDILGCCH